MLKKINWYIVTELFILFTSLVISCLAFSARAKVESIIEEKIKPQCEDVQKLKDKIQIKDIDDAKFQATVIENLKSINNSVSALIRLHTTNNTPRLRAITPSDN